MREFVRKEREKKVTRKHEVTRDERREREGWMVGERERRGG